MRDDHPKHRQRRRESWRLARRKASRAGLPAILIVCEGRETEPNYLNGLCDALGINRANVVIVPGDRETDAVHLVQKSRRRFEIDRDFDAVFVICDCVGEDLNRAHELATKPLRHVAGHAIKVQLIVNRPCIEFWLLLHFEYLARSMTAHDAIQLLRLHLPDYHKADRNIFEKVRVGFDRAISRATRLKAELTAVGVQSPDSDMPRLIEYLTALKRRGY